MTSTGQQWPYGKLAEPYPHVHDDDDDEHDDGTSDSDEDGNSSGHGANVTHAGNLSTRPPPKKRNRAALSCTLCRERKVKCDRVIPCQQCIKRGDTEFCHLDPNKRGPKPKGRKKARHSQELASAKQARDREMQQQRPRDQASFSTARSSSSSDSPHAVGQQMRGGSGALPHMAPPFDPQQPLGFSAMPTMPPAGPVRHSSSSSNLSASAGSDDMDTIKARLAQLEYVLAQQHRTASSNSPSSAHMPASSMLPPDGSMSSAASSSSRHPIATPPFQSSFGASPATMTGASPAHHRHYAQSDTGSAYFAQPSLTDSSPGQTGPSPRGTLYPSQSTLAAPFQSTTATSRNGASEQSERRISDGPVKDKTPAEGDTTAARGARGEVDSDTEDAALVLEGLAMGSRGPCGKANPKPERLALDIIEKTPLKSIQSFVDEDRTEDIMTEGKYRYDKDAKKKCGEAEADSNACGEDKEDEVLRTYLKENPDAEFGPDGKRLSPAKRVCVLLSKHKSLLELIWGPETFLGFGVGWAFPAAEAAGDMTNVSEIVGCKGALQREAVLRAIIRSLPQRHLAEHLVDVFDTRVKFVAGNCIHMPTFKKEMAAFYDLDTVEKRARVINFVDPGWLGLLLMIFVLALHFHPTQECEDVMHLFDGRTIHLWRSAAQTSLLLARYQTSTSIAVLQTILLMNIILLGPGKDTYHLTHAAISNALGMGLHRLGDKDKLAKAGETPAISIRREIAKRIWHQLVFLDWVLSTFHTGAYRIHPGHYNTPLPGNYNDEDLCKSPQPAPRPEKEHTEMSYPLAALKLGEVYRQNIEMLNASEQRRISCGDMAYLDASYRGLLEQAPPFYRIGASEGEGGTIEVERWLFQQSVFHKLLKLHRPQLSSRTSARTSCVLLARSILDMQRRIRSRCTIIDRLFINLSQSFSAAIVLCLDLLQTRPTANMRQIVRGEISEALDSLRHVGRSQHTSENSIHVIEALLVEEERRWSQPNAGNAAIAEVGGKRKRGGETGERRKDLLSLALRVAKAANGESASKTIDNGVLAEQKSEADKFRKLEQTEEYRSKDQQSRQLFEQLIMGRPSFAEPSSFTNSPFQSALFVQPSATSIAPNGLDLPSNFTPPDLGGGQPFDLNRFLAEVESNSSPDNGPSSAASDSGHSSLHNGGAGSSASSEYTSHSNGAGKSDSRARGSQGSGDLSLSPVNTFGAATSISTTPGGSVPMSAGFMPPSAFERPSTGLDGFWNWVLGQGAVNVASEGTSLPTTGHSHRVHEQTLNGGSSGATTGAAVSAPASTSNPVATPGSLMYSLNDNLAKIGGSAVRSDDRIEETLAEASTGATNGRGNGRVESFGSPSGQSHAGQAQSGRTPTASSAAATGGSDVPFYSIGSVGTPSAGIGTSWMSTPGLFDFAYEFGESGGGSLSQASATGSAANGASAAAT